MIRIGLLVPAKPLNGGVFQYTHSFIKTLIELKQYEITLYTGNDNHYFDDYELPIKRIKFSKLFELLYIIQAKVVPKHKDPFVEEDLVFAASYSTILLLTTKKVICTLHDLQECYFPENFSFAQKVWRKYLHTNISRKSNSIICESNFVKSDIVKFLGIPEEKVFVIQFPPLKLSPLNNSSDELESIMKRNNIPPNYIIYPANFWPHKNHENLIRAFSKLILKYNDICLILTGDKKREYKNIRRLIKELDLDKKIIILGYVEYTDLLCIFKKSICLVLPTLFESISIPVYEAFQLEVPVCASSVVGLPEQIGDAGILFNPKSVDSITNSLDKMLYDSSLRIDLINKGKMRLKSVSGSRLNDDLNNLLSSVYLKR